MLAESLKLVSVNPLAWPGELPVPPTWGATLDKWEELTPESKAFVWEHEFTHIMFDCARKDRERIKRELIKE